MTEQAGLSLTWSQTPKTGFLVTGLILYGELGRYPSDILIKSRMIGFWKRLICGKHSKIFVMLSNLMYQMHSRTFYNSKRLNFIENTLNISGYSEYWINENVSENCSLFKMVKISSSKHGIV